MSAKGMFRMMSKACFTELNEPNRSRKIAGDGHDDAEPLHCALLVLELPAPGDEVARRQFHGGVNLLLCLLYEAADVAVGHVALDDDTALRLFAADLRRAFGHIDVGQLAERNQRALR